jgi:hypothetical protein
MNSIADRYRNTFFSTKTMMMETTNKNMEKGGKPPHA